VKFSFRLFCRCFLDVSRMIKIIDILIFCLLIPNISVQTGEINNEVLFDLEYILGGDPNFNGNYKKLGAYKFHHINKNNFFINFNGFISDEKIKGISTGVGVRREYRKAVLGLNLYYDFQITSLNLHQIGLGVEYLSNVFDFNANVYLPIGEKKIKKKHLFDDYIGDYVVICKQKTVLCKAFDVSISSLLFEGKSLKSYISIGLYGANFHKENRFIGILGGLKLKFRGFFYLEPQFSYDGFYGTNLGIKFRMSIPFNRIINFQNKPTTRNMHINNKHSCNYQTNY